MDISFYLKETIQQIQGWCIPQLWHCIEPISVLQKRLGLEKPIAEIGVYHGKFFCGLALTAGANREHLAIDVFDLQHFNLDGSGKGNLEKFRASVEQCGLSNIEIYKGDSLSVPNSFVREKEDSFSMFSVDGCHTFQHTINDVRLALRMTDPRGLIYIDDYYNPMWPGVQEGMAKFFFTEMPCFVPFLFTCNKLFLCHLSYHSDYLKTVQDFIRDKHPKSRMKLVNRFGYDSLTVIPSAEDNTLIVLS